MELHVSGKLKTATAKQPSFTSFRIEAVFDQKPAKTPTPTSTSREITTLSDDSGNFTLVFPEQFKTSNTTSIERRDGMEIGVPSIAMSHCRPK